MLCRFIAYCDSTWSAECAVQILVIIVQLPLLISHRWTVLGVDALALVRALRRWVPLIIVQLASISEHVYLREYMDVWCDWKGYPVVNYEDIGVFQLYKMCLLLVNSSCTPLLLHIQLFYNTLFYVSFDTWARPFTTLWSVWVPLVLYCLVISC